MKTDNLLFTERPVSIDCKRLNAQRFCQRVMRQPTQQLLKPWNFSSLDNILGIGCDGQLNFKCCNPASVLNDMNRNSSILLFARHFFVINLRALNDEGAV